MYKIRVFNTRRPAAYYDPAGRVFMHAAEHCTGYDDPEEAVAAARRLAAYLHLDDRIYVVAA